MFFSKFPKSLYNFDLSANSTVMVTNILSRVAFKSEILSSASVFYKYQLQDGDTADIVAYKVYGNSEYNWIVMLVNGLKDLQFDVPLSTNALEQLIVKKYGYTGNTFSEQISQAFSDVHHYVLQTTKVLTEVDGITTTTVSNNIVTLTQYSYSTNTLSVKPENISYVYPHNTSNTVYFKANNTAQNTASAANATSSLKITEVYRPVYVYDYEFAENEKKREIKILRKEYVEPLSRELDSMLSGRFA